VVCASLSSIGTPGITVDVVEAFIGSIERKARFVSMHKRFLEQIDWDRIEIVGRTLDGNAAPESLKLSLHDALMEIHHPAAVMDHIYLAFDGLTSGVANLSDTLGRLVNSVYGLGIDRTRSSILAVRDKCANTSSLGGVLYDSRNTNWLTHIRDLRGRCQHADIEQVLQASTASSYARRGKPYVPREYWWNAPPTDVPIIDYANAAVAESERLMCACFASIVSNPISPTK
jgi:hypothetical protein